MNYFQFFDLPEAPSVDKTLLKKRFYQKSKTYHPDFYTLASAEKQAEALELSSLNNLAFKTLNADDQRLKYFLELKGALGEEGKNQVPQDFLLEIMDINENLMELEFDPSQALKEKTETMISQLEADLKQQIGSVFEDYHDGQDLEPLKDYYLKQRYLMRIKEKL